MSSIPNDGITWNSTLLFLPAEIASGTKEWRKKGVDDEGIVQIMQEKREGIEKGIRYHIRKFQDTEYRNSSYLCNRSHYIIVNFLSYLIIL